MLNYDSKVKDVNIDFILLSELELVIVTGLDLMPFYERLESEIMRKTSTKFLK